MKTWFDKRGVIADYLPWLLIGVATLAIIMLVIFLLKGSIFSLGDRIKDFLKIS